MPDACSIFTILDSLNPKNMATDDEKERKAQEERRRIEEQRKLQEELERRRKLNEELERRKKGEIKKGGGGIDDHRK